MVHLPSSILALSPTLSLQLIALNHLYHQEHPVTIATCSLQLPFPPVPSATGTIRSLQLPFPPVASATSTIRSLQLPFPPVTQCPSLNPDLHNSSLDPLHLHPGHLTPPVSHLHWPPVPLASLLLQHFYITLFILFKMILCFEIFPSCFKIESEHISLMLYEGSLSFKRAVFSRSK